MNGTARFGQTFARQLTCPADVLCCHFGLFIPQSVDRGVQLDNHSSKPLRQCIVNVAGHAIAFFECRGLSGLDREYGLVCESLREFDLRRLVRWPFGVADCEETLDFTSYKHR